MTENTLILKGEGNVDVQVGGAGNPWIYLSSCAHMSGPTVPLGGTEIRWCQDPRKANGFVISSKFRTAPDQISFDLMTKLGRINDLKNLKCNFNLRARFSKCGEREDVANYDPIMLEYCSAELTEYSYDDLVIADPANQDEILVTSPITASYEARVKKITPGRIGTASALGDQPINDIEYCDEETCGGYCGARSDGCTVLYAVTDADDAPYAAPGLIKIVRNLTTEALTITNEAILGVNGNVEGVECAGSRLVISSNGDSVVAYNDEDGDQDSWNLVSIDNAPAATPNALFARTARELWLGCVSGYVYKSVDGGSTWSAVHAGTITTQTINAVYAADADLVYAVGNNGVILKSTDGGQTWVDKTETSTVADNLLVVKVPPGRPKEVFVGSNAGQIFKSTDEGETFSNVAFTGDGVGSVDDLEFCGPCAGEVMFILHNDAGPRARILRDLSGGAGGADVEIIMGYTQTIAAGVDLNAITCCDVNTVVGAGENVSSYPTVIKAN